MFSLLSCDSLVRISHQPSPCQQLFSIFFNFFIFKKSCQVVFTKKRLKPFMFKSFSCNGERGIWTLAPVARPTPLAGAPLRPLEYFSELLLFLSQCKIYYNVNLFSCQRLFIYFFQLLLQSFFSLLLQFHLSSYLYILHTS